jgi:GAF domain-containing protein
MQDILNRIFDISQYTAPLDKERARIIYTVSILFIVVGIGLVGFERANFAEGNVQTLFGWDPSLGLVALGSTLCTLASIFFTRRGKIDYGSALLTLGWFFGFAVFAALSGLYHPISVVIVLSTVLFSGLLLRLQGMMLGVVLVQVLLVIAIWVRETTPAPEIHSAPMHFVVLFIVIEVLFVGLVYLYLRYSSLIQNEMAARTLSEGLKLSRITAQITQRVSRRTDLKDVLQDVVALITSNYSDIYHAQVFLVDTEASGQVARLVSSTGDVGKVLIERGHHLMVGSRSVIGEVTAHGHYVIARAGGDESVHRANEYLPETRVEAAFPLFIADEIIGALDLQSKFDDSFMDEEIPVFQTLADHIAIAIDNARLHGQTEQRMQENQRLVEQSKNARREVERLNMRLTGKAWAEYLQSNPNELSLDVDFEKGAIQPDGEWVIDVEEALANGEIVQEQRDGVSVISVPLQVQGHMIGAMEFELDKDGRLQQDDLRLISEVSERFGLAVENARLYEQSQRSAQREALINRISTRIQSTNSVESTLTEAAQSLQRSLRANRVAIRLGRPGEVNTVDDNDNGAELVVDEGNNDLIS